MPRSLTLLALIALCLCSSAAQAQIKRPGAHPRYALEIEPHAILFWEHEVWNDSGFGPGVRVNVPLMHNGPIDRINNNMAIGFGFDWAHFGDDCDYRGFGLGRNPFYEADCSGDTFTVPVVLQWNFFVTPRIWVFGEPGIAIGHTRWEYSFRYDCGTGFCEDQVDDDKTKVWFAFWGGARFLLTDSIAFTARVGTPYLSLGASFLL